MNFEKQSTLEKAEIDYSPGFLDKYQISPEQVTGLILIAISTLVFLLPEISTTQESQFGFFWFNYLIATGYFILLLCRKALRSSSSPKSLEVFMLFLVLGFISDFALNREMRIFNPSTTWLCVAVVSGAFALTAYSFKHLLPTFLHASIYFLLGTSWIMFGYFALYLLPFYAVGAFGTVALGLGLHIFVPLACVITIWKAATRVWHEQPVLKKAFVSGVFVPVLMVIGFLAYWKDGQNNINKLLNAYAVQDQQDLPRWVGIIQQIPVNPIYKRIIEADLIYQVASDRFSLFEMPDRRFDELQAHDPLVFLGSLFFGKVELEKEERIKILESMYDARHHAQERLWSGTHLSTSNVITQVQLFPQYRLSYTEKILNVHNNRPSSWGEEEAIYTFHLPEGSVVTSLSLWINGVEEKGHLTTQSKADSAYTTIVGVESRDPSVVHWQEGNTVSVRVFPCTPKESRRFKIGITSPMRKEEDQLVYDNIYFDGPASTGATETSVIRFDDTEHSIATPSGYEKKSNNRFERYGPYVADWQLKIPANKLSTNGFSFAGKLYKIEEYQPVFESFTPTRVYLDLNQNWTINEFDQVWEASKGKKMYAYDGNMVKLTEENKDEVFSRLQNLKFSLFPLNLVKEPEHAIIISKNGETSPNLQDLKESLFSRVLTETAQKRAAIRYYNLNTELSPYTRTLKELRLIQYAQGSSSQLINLLSEHKFVQPNLDSAAVVLDVAGIKIRQTEQEANQSQAPDHLLRLFAYNHLLQQIGPKYFQKEYLEEHLIAEAAQANVVSPLSSLVVLETQKDYERFGIEESKNSLGNASLKSSGAVPEPHEWALIVVAVALAAWLLYKRSFATSL